MKMSAFTVYEAMQDERAKLCFTFHNAHSALYFPLENIILEIVLHIQLKYHLHSCTMRK